MREDLPRGAEKSFSVVVMEVECAFFINRERLAYTSYKKEKKNKATFYLYVCRTLLL
jgi:hypothetical protein